MNPYSPPRAARVNRLIAKTRYRAARAAGTLLLGRTGRLPYGTVRSIGEKAWDSRLAVHVTEARVLSQPEVVDIPFPDDLPAWFRRTAVHDEQLVYRLRDVFVSPYSGLVWTPEGHVLLESLGSLLRLMTWSGARPDVLMSASTSTSDVPVIPIGDTGYYHFVSEVLPALLQACQLCPDGRVVVRPGVPRYVLDGIALAAQANGARLQVETAARPVRVQSAVLVSREEKSGFVRTSDLDSLSGLRGEIVDSPGIVYVSRTRSPKRRLEQEARIENFASSLGATVLHTEELSLSEQITALSGVRVLIGMHGAGLVNMVWSHRLEHVLEIFPPGYRNDCFARLAVQLGSQYHFVSLDEGDASVEIEAARQSAESLLSQVDRSSTGHP